MYARLGFAVAAFLKPAILIVDEILAVGDLSFQAKCHAHMRRQPKEGTTVLFVSHDLMGMADFCPRAMVIADGRLVFDGSTPEAIGIYKRGMAIPQVAEASVVGRPPYELRINGRLAGETIECRPNDALSVELEIDEPPDAMPATVDLNFVIETEEGRKAIHLRSDLDGTVMSIGPGRNTLTVYIEDLALVPGSYSLWLRVVALQAIMPAIWDTERLQLHVAGDPRLESIAQPRHRFSQGV
jgi:hypothetical protein